MAVLPSFTANTSPYQSVRKSAQTLLKTCEKPDTSYFRYWHNSSKLTRSPSVRPFSCLYSESIRRRAFRKLMETIIIFECLEFWDLSYLPTFDTAFHNLIYFRTNTSFFSRRNKNNSFYFTKEYFTC